jgi:hypothetical protein
LTNTEHLELRKPEYGDDADIADLNYNFDILDESVNGAQAVNTRQQTEIDEIYTKLSQLYDAIYNDITGNPFQMVFNTLDDKQVAGVWNKPLQRIEC